MDVFHSAVQADAPLLKALKEDLGHLEGQETPWLSLIAGQLVLVQGMFFPPGNSGRLMSQRV